MYLFCVSGLSVHRKPPYRSHSLSPPVNKHKQFHRERKEQRKPKETALRQFQAKVFPHFLTTVGQQAVPFLLCQMATVNVPFIHLKCLFERQKQNKFIPWVIPQVPTVTRVGSGPELGTQSRSPIGWQEPDRLPSLLLPRVCTDRKLE